ncbi:MAG: Re/Si-specific NAD(P)(+) transhydrogenase subunit alpha [Thermoleophilaceae bacterium]|nr:Re/Si-specific NAD(P)(+) transhydrogenase subunit alpha [Thermoleophilaceae bacterium]
MKLGVPKETREGETRVAIAPEAAKRLASKGVEVVVESGAGEGADVPDSAFEEAGVAIGDPWSADVVAKVQRPTSEEIGRLSKGSVYVGFLAPLTEPETAQALDSAGVTAFAMESIPRITRAQSMDALSSQATVAGYRAVLIAAQELGRFMPMLTTAAGTVKPAKALVMGAGVAGLQAIATCKRLGAQVQAFDVRSAVKEQIESLGAKFLELDFESDAEGEGGYARELTPEEQKAQQAALNEAVKDFDVVITTALVPGRPAPKLVSADAVRGMAPGSVIVDLAGEAGGNCDLSEPGQTVVKEGVTIAAPLNLPATMAQHASQLYARNVAALVELMVGEEGALELNWEDDILQGACVAGKQEPTPEADAEEAPAEPVPSSDAGGRATPSDRGAGSPAEDSPA